MADRMLVAFGKYLKILRDRRGLSLNDVATLTKSYPEPVGKGYLSRVERGLARVGFSKMVALSRAYEVSLDALGEKLSLDLEVDELKNAPSTSGKTFGELTEEGARFSKRGMKWHFYAAIRDAQFRAATDPLIATNQTRQQQVVRAALSHGVAARATGRFVLALIEFEYVAARLDDVAEEVVPIVFQQSAVAKRHLGAIQEADSLIARAFDCARQAPLQKHLGDVLETRAHFAKQAGDCSTALATYQEAFAAYKAIGNSVDCARTLNNLAQAYFDTHRYKAARRSLAAADRLASAFGANGLRARSRILLGEIHLVEGNQRKAADTWHDAIEIARRTRDSVTQFKAEFQLFKLAIAEKNSTAVQALGRRLFRMSPWISRSEPEVIEFLRLFPIYRKPKQRGVANQQLSASPSDNPPGAELL